MKIVVIGGTGLIGSKVVEKLTKAGHKGVAASRSTGVDILTGDGLEQVLEGARAVIDVSSPGYRDAGEMLRFFETSGTNLIEAERNVGIDLHVTLSAVGVGRVEGGYFGAKKLQEELVFVSDIPFMIVRSTPVFEYIYNIVDTGGEGEVIRLPPVRVQPISADDLAFALHRVALGSPENTVIEVAGPDTYQLPRLAEEILTAYQDCRTVLVDENAPYFGARLGGEALTGADHPRIAPSRFDDWLRNSLIPA